MLTSNENRKEGIFLSDTANEEEHELLKKTPLP